MRIILTHDVDDLGHKGDVVDVADGYARNYLVPQRIAVVASAPHRAEAFETCRHVIEEAKKRLPVWKKEIFENGAEAWREH